MSRNARSKRRQRTSPLDNPIIRVMLAGAAVVLIVVLCIAATSVMPKVDPASFGPTPDPHSSPTPVPTPTPEPTITPTPALRFIFHCP